MKITRKRLVGCLRAFGLAGAMLLCLFSRDIFIWWHYDGDIAYLIWGDADFDPNDPKFPARMHPPVEDPPAVPVLDAREVLAEYARDPVATTKKYKGRVWLKGKVTEFSGPSVELEGPNGIVCTYVSLQDQEKMQIGQVITIEGDFDGGKHMFRQWKRR